MAAAAGENIKIGVRLRKALGKECDRPTLWRCCEPDENGHCDTILSVDGAKVYNFDHVFGPNDTTDVVYDAIATELIKSAVSGINATIFAYGQTGSGNIKFHT
jgi:centromeric protein E